MIAEVKEPYPFIAYIVAIVICFIGSTLLTELEKAKAVEAEPCPEQVELVLGMGTAATPDV